MENEDLHTFQQNLIEDISFIRWVQSDFEVDNDKWSVFIDEHIDHSDEINKAIKFVGTLRFKEEASIDADGLWKKIQNSTHGSGETKVVRMKPWKWIAGIAAVAIAILMIFKPLSSDDHTKTFKADIAKRMTEAFPDGSAFILNPGSEITFDAENWDKDRKVTLKGLAFFEVRKGARFVVETAQGNVTVLGTSFSVDARNNKFEVICKTGKVAVTSKKGEEKLLEKGDVAMMVDGILLTQTMPEGTFGLIPWMEGSFIFNNADFGEVIMEIENQYGVTVEMDLALKNEKYTGFFKNNDINEALFSITWPLKLKYTINDKKVSIVKE